MTRRRCPSQRFRAKDLHVKDSALIAGFVRSPDTSGMNVKNIKHGARKRYGKAIITAEKKGIVGIMPKTQMPLETKTQKKHTTELSKNSNDIDFQHTIMSMDPLFIPEAKLLSKRGTSKVSGLIQINNSYGNLTSILLDTGAFMSVVNEKYLKKYEINYKVYNVISNK